MTAVKNKVEALLFSSGRRMTLEELRRITKARPDEIKEAIQEFKQELQQRGSSILLVEDGEDAWKLTIENQHIPLVRKVVSKTELPKTLLETLAIVAWKAPVLQSEIIKMRTNKAYDDLRNLENKGYISRAKHGRTKMIKLAQKFFDYFDIPPDKVKEKFARFEEVEKAIQSQENQVEDAHKKIEEMKKKRDEDQKKIENIDEELDKIPVPKIEVYHDKKEETKVEAYGEDGKVEIIKEKEGELEVYEESEEGQMQEEEAEEVEEEAPEEEIGEETNRIEWPEESQKEEKETEEETTEEKEEETEKEEEAPEEEGKEEITEESEEEKEETTKKKEIAKQEEDSETEEKEEEAPEEAEEHDEEALSEEEKAKRQEEKQKKEEDKMVKKIEQDIDRRVEMLLHPETKEEKKE